MREQVESSPDSTLCLGKSKKQQLMDRAAKSLIVSKKVAEFLYRQAMLPSWA
jgi:hypothetical protein